MGKPSLKVDQGLVRKLSTYFLRRPGNLFCRVYGSEQAIKNADWGAVVVFDTERWDTGENSSHVTGFWNAAAPTRLTAPVSGNYIITGHITFAYHATGIRGIGIAVVRPGGAAVIIAQHTQMPCTPDPTVTTLSIATAYWRREDDYVQLAAYQNSGGNLNVNEQANYSPEFTITRVP